MGNPAAPAPHRFQALDSLRGVAALIVAIQHLGAQGPVLGHRFFWLGSLWVDFFFVLSGFVIASAYGERLLTGYPPRRFLWLRAGRIWPVHLVVLLAYLGIELIVWVSGSATLTGRPAFAFTRSPGDFAVQLLLLQALVPTAIMTWSVQSWSISVEMFLYVLAALGWRRLGRGWWLASLGTALMAGWLMTRPEWIGGYHKLLRGLCGFGLGVVAWRAWTWLEPWARKSAGAAMSTAELGLSALLVWVILRAGFLPFTLGFDLLFAVLVLVFAPQRGMVSRVLLWRPFVWLGAVSYSLYMVHPLAESAAMSAMAWLAGGLGWQGLFVAGASANRPALSGALGLYADLGGLAALLVAVLAAGAMYALVERPLREWSRRIAPRIG